eukprot:8087837-Pyramimonas_sp.AAC.1
MATSSASTARKVSCEAKCRLRTSGSSIHPYKLAKVLGEGMLPCTRPYIPKRYRSPIHRTQRTGMVKTPSNEWLVAHS